jgi:hypothetical protein
MANSDLSEVTMKNYVRLIVTMMSVALLLGGTLAVVAVAADDKTPQGTAITATPKPPTSNDDNSKERAATPTVKSAEPTSTHEATPPTATSKAPTPTTVGQAPPPAATAKPDEEKNESSDHDDENDDNTPVPAAPPLSFSFIPNSTGSMFVDGFGPVAVTSVQLTNGQTVTIPSLPYSPNMVWGTFGTYANWAAQFQAANGRPPTEQDAINFWISQALAGVLKISPTP